MKAINSYEAMVYEYTMILYASFHCLIYSDRQAPGEIRKLSLLDVVRYKQNQIYLFIEPQQKKLILQILLEYYTLLKRSNTSKIDRDGHSVSKGIIVTFYLQFLLYHVRNYNCLPIDKFRYSLQKLFFVAQKCWAKKF